MFNRKSLFVALSVLVMLAMMVPAAFAAPEWTHSIAITKVAPEFVFPGDITVDYTLSIVGTQVHDVRVRFWVLDQYGNKMGADPFAQKVFDNSEKDIDGTLVLTPGDHKLTQKLKVGGVFPYWNQGWYDVAIEAQDGEYVGMFWVPQGDVFTDSKAKAFFLDWEPPTVKLTKPSNFFSFVTGQKFELMGEATDNVEVKRAWFLYSALFNIDDAVKVGNEDADGIGQDATPGANDTFSAIWDTSVLPDDAGFIWFCAEDEVGLVNCTSGQAVKIENRVVIELKAGWNLISSPLILYSPNLEAALLHLQDHGTVDKVFTYDGQWKGWKAGGPDGVKQIKDGQGYWLHMISPDELTLVGTWLDVDADQPATPPQYNVVAGWNLIGWTHWGTPTDSIFGSTVAEYLGPQLSPAVESMYYFDAGLHSYLPVGLNSDLVQGMGYWLASAQAGTINP